MARSYYDDNFGFYEGMEGPDAEDNLEFYRQNQKRSRRKKCQGCGQMVKILPEYAYCNSCADKRERGYDI
jgi:hypothetical protein